MEITNILYQSFLINNEIKSEAILYYFKTNLEKWYKVVIDEGTSKIVEIEENLIKNEGDIQEFYYPIKKLEINCDELGSILSIKQYLKNNLISKGFLFVCKNKTFSITDDYEDNLFFKTGIDVEEINKFDLIEYQIKW
jgi:hypothetical protein